MIRGYITIATGDLHYYMIAASLLKSYRTFTNNPLPFCIIAEEENEYTKQFDDVIITKESSHSFLDKFLLLKLCPYDETIFFDADSLAYGDLNKWWDFFDNSTDFSALGVNVDKNSSDAWYNVEDIWKYGDMIEYKSRVHAGVMFFRKSKVLNKIYEDCLDIYRNYDKLFFHTCGNAYDEAILGIAMPMNNMKALRENPELFGCYPCLSYLKTDMIEGRLSIRTDWDGYTDRSTLLHFGTFHTYEPLYRFDVECLDYMNSPRKILIDKIKYEHKLRLVILKGQYEIEKFKKRVFRFIKNR